METEVSRCEAVWAEEGTGRITIRGYLEEWEDWTEVDVTGSDVGDLLRQVLAWVTDPSPHRSLLYIRGLGELDVLEAGRLLETLVVAAAAAVANVDKFNRVFRGWTGKAPDPPICHVCGFGSDLVVTDTTWLKRCEEKGHQPFAGSAQQTWDQAHDAFRESAKRHSVRLKCGPPYPAIG
jgi:hypothetical protein